MHWITSRQKGVAPHHCYVCHCYVCQRLQDHPLTYLNVCPLSTGHSVLVAAHTSAGKTVVAEYAFAMALRYMGLVGMCFLVQMFT